MASTKIGSKLNSHISVWVLLAGAVMGVVYTHPLWRHVAEAVPSDIGDPLLNTWILAWDAHASLSDPTHLFDANIYYPLTKTLAYSEHMVSTALLALPIQAASGEPVLAYNLSLLLTFPLAGLGMYCLVLRWTGRREAALFAGVAFAFAPYRLAAIAHVQLLTIQWLPFSLLALEGLLSRRATVRSLSLFVVFTLLQALVSWYLAVFTVAVQVLYALSWLVAHWRDGRGKTTGARLLLPGSSARRALIRLVIASLVLAGAVLPFAMPYIELLPQLRMARPVTWGLSFAAKPVDFLSAAPVLRSARLLSSMAAQRQGLTNENMLFLGFATSLMAMIGLVLGRPRWRVFGLAGILALCLAMTFAGPYLHLTRLLPPLQVIRVPARWIIPATLALAALAGYGVASFRSRKSRRCVLLVAGLLMVAESLPARLPLASVGSRTDLAPVYEALVELGSEGLPSATCPQGAVVELPMHVAPAPEFPETKRLYASTIGWWGLVNGYSGFTPQRQVELGQRLAGFPSHPASDALRELGMLGVRYLVVHPDQTPLSRDRWDATARWQVEHQTTFLPVGRFGPDDLYLINPYGDDLIDKPGIVEDTCWLAGQPIFANVRFDLPGNGGAIRLLAYLVQPAIQVAAGNGDAEASRLTLYWQISDPIDTSYTVFVHGLDAMGNQVGQADGPPVGNHYPTNAWIPGEIVQDSRLVPTASSYLVGLYDLVSGERLSAFTADGLRLPDDALPLPAE